MSIADEFVWLAERRVYAPISGVPVSLLTIPTNEGDTALGMFNDVGWRIWPIEHVAKERLSLLIEAAIFATAAPTSNLADYEPRTLVSQPIARLRETVARQHRAFPDGERLTAALFNHSFMPIPRSPSLASRSLNTILASTPAISAWLALDPPHAIFVALGTPLYIVVIGAASGIAEGLHDRLYEAIMGRRRRT